MRKVFLQCEACGQRMQVSRSAIGKKGMCPRCGKAIPITSQNTTPFYPNREPEQPVNGGAPGSSRWKSRLFGPSDDAKQRFGMGVDLFCSGRYGEALAIFDSLARQFPSNPDIQSAREQCTKARNRTAIPLPGPESPSTQYAKNLDATSVKEAVLEKLMSKMQYSASETIQLQAAELLLRLLPSLQNGKVSSNDAKEEVVKSSAEAQNNTDTSFDTQEPHAEDSMNEKDFFQDQSVDDPLQGDAEKNNWDSVPESGKFDQAQPSNHRKEFGNDVLKAYAEFMEEERAALSKSRKHDH